MPTGIRFDFGRGALLALLLATTAVATSHDGQNPAPAPRPGAPADECTLAGCLRDGNVDAKALTPKESEILEAILAGREPKFADVTEAWLAAEVRRYNAARKTDLSDAHVRGLFREAITGPRVGYWSRMKKRVEEFATARLHKSEFFHNEAYGQTLDALLEGKAQADGFATFLVLATRAAWPEKEYRQQRPVVVFTNGRSLPGFVRDGKDGGELVGVETAVRGDGVHSFGPVRDVAKLVESVRVVDAEAFAIFQLFADRMSDATRACVATALIRQGATRFGFDGEAIEARARKLRLDDTKPLAASEASAAAALGLGRLDVPPGDLRRPTADKVDGKTSVIPTAIVAPQTPPSSSPVSGTTPPSAAPVPPPAAAEKTALVRKIRELDEDFAAGPEIDKLEREAVATLRHHLERSGEGEATDAAVEKTYGRLAADRKIPEKAREETVAYLQSYVKSQVPESVRKASLEVHRAAAAVEKVLGPAAKAAKSEADLRGAVSDVALDARVTALRSKPERREAVVESVLKNGLAKVPGLDARAREALVLVMKESLLRQFEADAAWLPVSLPGLGRLPALPPKAKK